MRIAVCPGEVRPVAITGTSLPLCISQKDPCASPLYPGGGGDLERCICCLKSYSSRVTATPDSHAPHHEGFRTLVKAPGLGLNPGPFHTVIALISQQPYEVMPREVKTVVQGHTANRVEPRTEATLSHTPLPSVALTGHSLLLPHLCGEQAGPASLHGHSALRCQDLFWVS